MLFNAQRELKELRSNGAPPTPKSMKRLTSDSTRCRVGLSSGSKMQRIGKKSFHYLEVLRFAQVQNIYFYMCDSGDHWHVTSTPKFGALSGRLK